MRSFRLGRISSFTTVPASSDAKEEHTSGIKTPLLKGRRVAGGESPAYRSRSAIIHVSQILKYELGQAAKAAGMSWAGRSGIYPRQ
jgi:hypothetical protein